MQGQNRTKDRRGEYQKQDILLRLSFSKVVIQEEKLGEDLLLVIRGGDKPHIGCTILTIPRPSLKGDGTCSCTSSVLNVTGHKDEEICRYLAEKAAKKYNCTVVCTGGFHVDHMKPEEIRELMDEMQRVKL